MNEHTEETAQSALENRSRALFHDSVEGLDMRVRSRLTQARHAALDAASVANRRSWILRPLRWTPVAGITAAAVLGAALWWGLPLGTADNQSNLEDLDMVAASDGNSGDALEMLQDDLDFYDFADKAGSSDPAA
jgi:hypothetical protein